MFFQAVNHWKFNENQNGNCPGLTSSVTFLSGFISCFIITGASAFFIRRGSRDTLPSHIKCHPQMTSGRCSSSQMTADSIVNHDERVNVWFTHDERLFPECLSQTQTNTTHSVMVWGCIGWGVTLCARVVYTGKWIDLFRLHCDVICSQWDGIVLSRSKTCTDLLNGYRPISSFHVHDRNIWSWQWRFYVFFVPFKTQIVFHICQTLVRMCADHSHVSLFLSLSLLFSLYEGQIVWTKIHRLQHMALCERQRF